MADVQRQITDVQIVLGGDLQVRVLVIHRGYAPASGCALRQGVPASTKIVLAYRVIQA